MNIFRWTLLVILINLGMYAQQPLKVTGTLQKSTYLFGEPVELVLEYKNATSSIIGPKDIGRVRVTLVNGKGDTLRECFSGNYNFSAHPHTYQPDESTFLAVELNFIYGHLFLPWVAANCFDNGQYTVIICSSAPDGKIERKELRFDVVNPDGNELVVLNKFTEIMSTMAPKTGPTTQTQIDTLTRLHEKYPGSIYSPTILEIIISFYHIIRDDRIKANVFATEMVEKYPGSVRSQYQLPNLINKITTKQERVDFLRKIHTASKNTLMEKVYEKQLEEELNK